MLTYFLLSLTNHAKGDIRADFADSVCVVRERERGHDTVSTTNTGRRDAGTHGGPAVILPIQARVQKSVGFLFLIETFRESDGGRFDHCIGDVLRFRYNSPETNSREYIPSIM